MRFFAKNNRAKAVALAGCGLLLCGGMASGAEKKAEPAQTIHSKTVDATHYNYNNDYVDPETWNGLLVRAEFPIDASTQAGVIYAGANTRAIKFNPAAGRIDDGLFVAVKESGGTCNGYNYYELKPNDTGAHNGNGAILVPSDPRQVSLTYSVGSFYFFGGFGAFHNLNVLPNANAVYILPPPDLPGVFIKSNQAHHYSDFFVDIPKLNVSNYIPYDGISAWTLNNVPNWDYNKSIPIGSVFFWWQSGWGNIKLRDASSAMGEILEEATGGGGENETVSRPTGLLSVAPNGAENAIVVRIQ